MGQQVYDSQRYVIVDSKQLFVEHAELANKPLGCPVNMRKLQSVADRSAENAIPEILLWPLAGQISSAQWLGG
jgi:hypothetical protein